MLTLKLCGRPEARVGDRLVQRVRSDRVWGLMGYLALRGREWVPRVEVAAALWPEASESVARKRLRQTLLYVREAFCGAEALNVTDKLVRLADGVDTDVSGNVPADFLETLDDPWILAERGEMSVRLEMEPVMEGQEDAAVLRRDLAGLSRPEVDEYVRGHLPIWMRTGRLEGPLHVLEDLADRQQLGAEGLLSLAEMRLWRGELALCLKWLRHRSVDAAIGPLAAWRSFLEGVHAHRSGSAEDAYRHYKLALRNPNASPVVWLQAQYQLGFVDPVHMSASRLRRVAADGMARADEIGDPFRRMTFELLLAYADHHAHDRSSALVRLAKFEQYFSVPGRPHQTAPLLYRAGRLYQELEALEPADRCFAVALEHASLTDNPRLHAEALTYVADRKLEQGCFADGMLLHLEALAIRRGGQAPWAIATSLRGAGLAALRQGMHFQARPLLAEAVELFERVGDRFAASSALFALAQLARERGNIERARKYATATLEMLNCFGDVKTTLYVPAIYATPEGVENFLQSLSHS